LSDKKKQFQELQSNLAVKNQRWILYAQHVWSHLHQ